MVAQSCPTLCDPMDCSLRGSYIHGIFEARVLEWVAISFSRGSSRLRDRTRVSDTLPSKPPGKLTPFCSTKPPPEVQEQQMPLIKEEKSLSNIRNSLELFCG